jgi:tetratricopeptide (TPR) repeat protein
MTRLTAAAKDIAESFLKREIAIFHGGGLSTGSGIPAARPLTEEILKRIVDYPSHYSWLKSAKFPFELFMQTLADKSDISPLLDVYRAGSPNINHRLFADLVANGMLRCIATTNFDTLTERCLKEKLSDERVDVCWNEGTFQEMQGRRLAKPANVFKLHGTIEDEVGLGITLNEVAKRQLVPWKHKLVRSFYSGRFSKKILVLGYSCSDPFDICPAIRSVKGNRAEVVFVEHSRHSQCKITALGKGISLVFAGYPGQRIKCKTQELIEELWTALRPTIGHMPDRTLVLGSEWKRHVDIWFKSLNHGAKRGIAGALFQRMHAYGMAAGYYRREVEATGSENISTRERALSSLLWAYTMSNLNKAQRLAERITDPPTDGRARCVYYTALGTINHHYKNFAEAIKNHKLALLQARGDKDEENIAFCLHNLASACGAQIKHLDETNQASKANGLVEEALAYLHECKEIAHDNGWPYPEARAYLLLGQFHARSKEWNKANNCIRKARSLSSLLFERGLVSICLQNLGDVSFEIYQENNNPSARLKAIRCYKEGIRFAKDTEREIEGLCHVGLSRLYKNRELISAHCSLAKACLSKSAYYSERLRLLPPYAHASSDAMHPKAKAK